MGGWDALCLICGLCPGGGPDRLFLILDYCLNRIIESLQELNLDLNIEGAQLHEEIRNLLLMFDLERSGQPTKYEKAIREGTILPGPYFPFKNENWDGWKSIAIGVFGEDGLKIGNDSETRKGSVVTALLVTRPTGYGGTFEGIDGSDKDIQIDASTMTSNFFSNFFCLRAPYYYLQCWVDRDSLPPRENVFPLEPNMSFEGELYEIVNSRKEPRDDDRIMPCIDYEGIELSLDQFQQEFSGSFCGAHELGRALKAGLRGNDLIPALLRDFKVWQTCPTDRWIKSDSTSSRSSSFQVSSPATSGGLWQKFPVEIVLQILPELTIQEILSFTSSCRYLYVQFGNQEFLSLILRVQFRQPLSDAYWFLPVATVEGEVEKFCKACDESNSPEVGVATLKSSGLSVVFDASFPLMDYFRINYPTDSMKNRRRLWRISQQFRREWYKYRTEGYENGGEESHNAEGSASDEEEDGTGDEGGSS